MLYWYFWVGVSVNSSFACMVAPNTATTFLDVTAGAATLFGIRVVTGATAAERATN